MFLSPAWKFQDNHLHPVNPSRVGLVRHRNGDLFLRNPLTWEEGVWEAVEYTEQKPGIHYLSRSIQNYLRTGYRFCAEEEDFTAVCAEEIPDIPLFCFDIETTGFKWEKNEITVISVVSQKEKRVFSVFNSKTSTEKKMLMDFVKYIEKARGIIVGFNSDQFDIPFIRYRCSINKISCPFFVNDYSFETIAGFKGGLHLDLYKFFKIEYVRSYVMGPWRYERFRLEDVASAYLEEGKKEISFDEVSSLRPGVSSELSRKFEEYCLYDSELLLKILLCNNRYVFSQMILLSRITNTALDGISRRGLTHIIKNALELYLLQHNFNFLIKDYQKEPLKESFTGGYTIHSKKGVYQNVLVLDWVSLYPSIIERFRLSFENMNLYPARELVIGDNTFVVGTRSAILSDFISEIKTLRVELKKKKHPANQTLKVLMNGTYGAMGDKRFKFSRQIVSEAITAIGRHSLKRLIEFVEQSGFGSVVGGDTDSIFLHPSKPAEEIVPEIIKFSQTQLQLDLEHEKTYDYLFMSDRKKNYFAFLGDKVIFKGVSIKKRNSPPFLKVEVEKILQYIRKMGDVDKMRGILREKCQHILDTLFLRPPEDFFYLVRVNPSKEYKTIPQGRRALDFELETFSEKIREDEDLVVCEIAKICLHPGMIPSYVTALTRRVFSHLKFGVEDLDQKTYYKIVYNSLLQIVDPFGVELENKKVKKKK